MLKSTTQKQLETKQIGITFIQTAKKSVLERIDVFIYIYIHTYSSIYMNEMEHQASKMVFSRSNIKLVAESRQGPRFSFSTGKHSPL